MPTTVTFNSGSNVAWPVPAGVSSLQIECWGPGGDGGEGDNSGGGGGGGGGAYSIKTVSVTGGVTTVAYVVGAGGTQVATTAVIVSPAVSMSAGGGLDGGNGNPLPGTGGAAGTATGGDTNTPGVAGDTADMSSNGGNGGRAGNPGGGAGGAGNTAGSFGTGSPGSAPGGGGGGGADASNTSGGAGAAGRVSFTYTASATVTSRFFELMN